MLILSRGHAYVERIAIDEHDGLEELPGDQGPIIEATGASIGTSDERSVSSNADMSVPPLQLSALASMSTVSTFGTRDPFSITDSALR